MASLKTWLCDFRDLISPRYCPICGNRLNSTEEEVCGKCLMMLPYIPIKDFYDNPTARLFWAKIPVERAHSYIRYHNEWDSHRLLMFLKYNHRPDIGRWMGRLMARDLHSMGFFEDMDCIAAVPLHWKRQMKRGYNQSIELARGVADITGLPLVRRQIVRLRNNSTQTRKSMEERIENVESLFHVKSRLPYHHILLIDDVLTTGATLTACAKAILQHNPEMKVSILTLAKA